jgi:hypothetical protein
VRREGFVPVEGVEDETGLVGLVDSLDDFAIATALEVRFIGDLDF